MQQTLVQSSNYRWWVFWTIALGTFLTVVDVLSVGVALPRIESHFNTDLATVQWVVVGYVLVISVLLLPMGRLGDMVGRKQVYIAGLTIFALATGVAIASANLPMLVITRAIQGAGSAMIQGNAMAMLISVFPSQERGKVLGSHLAVVGAGAVVGPISGGLLVSAFGWRSVFVFDVLAGALAAAAAAIILDRKRFSQQAQPGQTPVDPPLPEGHTGRFDWPGAVLSGVALLLFLLVIGNGYRLEWSSAPILLGIAGFLALLAAFIWWELRCDSPMLELRLFKRSRVALGIAAAWLSFAGSSATFFMMPFFFQNVQGYSPRQSGLFMVPGAICIALTGYLSGRLLDRFGGRLLSLIGAAVIATGLILLGTILEANSPLALVIPLIILVPLGQGLFGTPNNTSILSAVESSRYGVVSALTQLARNTGSLTSISFATAIVGATMASQGFEASLRVVSTESGPAVSAAFMSGLRLSFLVMGGLLLIGFVLSSFKGQGLKEEGTGAGIAGPQGTEHRPVS